MLLPSEPFWKKYSKDDLSLYGYIPASITGVSMPNLHGILELSGFTNFIPEHLLLLQKSLIQKFTGAKWVI